MSNENTREVKTRIAFGKYCRSARKTLFPELTIDEFAKRIDISGPYLTRIELGKVSLPSEKVIAALSNLLGFKPDFFEALSNDDKHPLCSKLNIDITSVDSILPTCFSSNGIDYAKGDVLSISDFLRFFGELCVGASEFFGTTTNLQNQDSLTVKDVLNEVLPCMNGTLLPIREHAFRSMLIARTKRIRELEQKSENHNKEGCKK